MKVIDIDLDDTICDFTNAYNEARENDTDIKYPQSQYGFFTNLKPIDGAINYIQSLRNYFEVHIVSRPSIKNLLCYTEKAEWVRRHFGEDMLNRLTLTCHKNRLDGDYLIDDTLWPLYKGEQILFGRAPFENWYKVYIYLLRKEKIID
jgi:5'-nucleotidase